MACKPTSVAVPLAWLCVLLGSYIAFAGDVTVNDCAVRLKEKQQDGWNWNCDDGPCDNSNWGVLTREDCAEGDKKGHTSYSVDDQFFSTSGCFEFCTKPDGTVVDPHSGGSNDGDNDGDNKPPSNSPSPSPNSSTLDDGSTTSTEGSPSGSKPPPSTSSSNPSPPPGSSPAPATLSGAGRHGGMLSAFAVVVVGAWLLVV